MAVTDRGRLWYAVCCSYSVGFSWSEGATRGCLRAGIMRISVLLLGAIMLVYSCDRIPTFQIQQGPLKLWYPTTTLHGVTTQKTSTRNLRVHKRRGISWLAEWVLAFKLGLCSMGSGNSLYVEWRSFRQQCKTRNCFHLTQDSYGSSFYVWNNMKESITAKHSFGSLQFYECLTKSLRRLEIACYFHIFPESKKSKVVKKTWHIRLDHFWRHIGLRS
jgi:hypothetical protein